MTKNDLFLFLFVLSISATSLIRVKLSDLLNMCFVMFLIVCGPKKGRFFVCLFLILCDVLWKFN